MMFLIRYWRSLTKRDRVLKVLNIKLKKILHVPILHFLDAFFTDPDFWPIRIQIRTKEKKSDPDPEKNPDQKH